MEHHSCGGKSETILRLNFTLLWVAGWNRCLVPQVAPHMGWLGHQRTLAPSQCPSSHGPSLRSWWSRNKPAGKCWPLSGKGSRARAEMKAVDLVTCRKRVVSQESGAVWPSGVWHAPLGVVPGRTRCPLPLSCTPGAPDACRLGLQVPSTGRGRPESTGPQMFCTITCGGGRGLDQTLGSPVLGPWRS